MNIEVRHDFRDLALRRRIEARVGRVHANQRLGIETEFEGKVFDPRFAFFHLENWYSFHSVIRNALRAVGLYDRARRNILDIQVRENTLPIPGLPEAFHGFRILQVTDLHVDLSEAATEALCQRLRGVQYDICVLTGDYRAATFGDYAPAQAGMRRVRSNLGANVYGVLGNHDTIRMLPGLEEMGIRMLINESVAIERGGEALYLAGIDDAHYYHVDNIEKAAQHVPENAPSILLSHTPETFRQAAHAQFDGFLCGHTHGGQLCLPGGFPLTWDARCPRRMAAGSWTYHGMQGFTSVGSGSSIVPVRLNCPPEIVIHHLRPA